jgi:SAM-dependent methyltransferase
MVTPENAPPLSLQALVNPPKIGRDTESGWRELKPTILRLAAQTHAKRLLEIGGGRFPFLTPAEVNGLNCELTVNDIASSELALAPPVFPSCCFDIAQELPASLECGSFNLVFSRMVFEHVRDARKAWANVYRLLSAGGIGFAYVPTLFSPPFVVNLLSPEALSGRMLRSIDSDRTDAKVPKFPAYYHLCRASQGAVEPQLTKIGFKEVVVVPFFGTPYLPVVPLLKHIGRAFDKIVERLDARTFASYAYIIARK